jgi:hypothetical protein
MLSFWASKDDAAPSSAVHHLQGAPALKGVCYVSATVHYKHDESSTADGEGREVAVWGGRHSSSTGVRAGAEF